MYRTIIILFNLHHRHASASPFSTSETTLTTVREEHSNQPPAEQDGANNRDKAHTEEEGGGGGGTSTVQEDGGDSIVNGDVFAEESKESQEKERMDETEVDKDAPLIERTLKEVETSDGAPPSVVVSLPDGTAQVEELAEPDTKSSREIQSSTGLLDEAAKHENENIAEPTCVAAEGRSDSTEDMLAIMGAAEPIQSPHSSQNSESSESVVSLDALLADSPYFLHIYVNPKSLHAHTYTPVNSSVGIDIPRSRSSEDKNALIGDHTKKTRSLSPPVVHHVRNQFCFAIVDKR